MVKRFRCVVFPYSKFSKTYIIAAEALLKPGEVKNEQALRNRARWAAAIKYRKWWSDKFGDKLLHKKEFYYAYTSVRIEGTGRHPGKKGNTERVLNSIIGPYYTEKEIQGG